ncbi:MAG: hypothetical protein U0Q03_06525 [Acidimicrobiales bacterium]
MSNDDTWHVARLIPTSGINGQDEAERRATSALLAVASIVREFGLSLVKPLGAPSSALETFIEVPFKVEERKVIPDGLIRARRGTKTWVALVEVKTGTSHLERAQLEDYLDVAREQGFDAVLTISNEISHAPGVHPTAVDRRRLKKVALYHYSWSEILTLAVQHRVWRGVADPEQAWILGELIRYLEHPKSGATDFADMGEPWTAVRDSVAHGTLRASDRGLAEVVQRWEQLLQFAALRMGRQLGAEVEVVRNRKEKDDPTIRLAAQTAELVERGRLTGSIRIPQAINDIAVVADVRAGRVHVSVDVAAPTEGRQATRVGWLLRQLKDAPDQLRIDSWSVMSRHSMSELLSVARATPERLIEDPKKDLRSFRITATSALGTKRGAGRGGFIDSVLSALEGFYEIVVQDLRPWVAKAPQLPSSGRSAVEEAGIDLKTPPSDLQDTHDEVDDEASDVIADDGSVIGAPVDHELGAEPVEIVEQLGEADGDFGLLEVSSGDERVEDANHGDEDDTAQLMSWASVAERDDSSDQGSTNESAPFDSPPIQ